MASIDDIRINGETSSSTDSPIVAGFNPVITWEFVSDVATPSQASRALRIGSTNTNWGSNSFDGNIVSISEENSGSSYEHDIHNLSRGQTYFGQIQATDPDGDKTSWSQFQFKVNSLPFITNQRLSPVSPSLASDIDLIYTYQDPDDHDQSGTRIRWFRDNLPISRHDGLCTLPASATSAGESWVAKILPSDGIEFGAVTETPAVIIQEIDTSFTSVQILPLDANVDDILKVEWVLEDSEYVATTGVIEIEWFINGVAVADSNSQFIRLELNPGDVVHVIIRITDGESVLAELRSDNLTISDVLWFVFDLEISGLIEVDQLADLEPILEWKIHKTTADSGDAPAFLRVLVTKTPSLDGPILDTGVTEYTKSSFAIPDNILDRGQRYFFHVGVGDSNPIDEGQFITKEVQTSGSSWENQVSNSTGWTIEFKVAVAPGITLAEGDPEPNLGLYIHDGTYFATITLAWNSVTFLSSESVTFNITEGPNLSVAKTFKVVGKNTNVQIFMNNQLIIDVQGAFSNPSQLKRLEFGDIDGKNINFGTFRFFRYSTVGAFGLESGLPNEDTFFFSNLGQIEGGSIDYVFDNLISWLPDDVDESAKLIKFNENSVSTRLPTVTRNFSPITTIHVDKNRNKYIGTANGVTAIFGDKHDPDYQLDTSDDNVQIFQNDFDRISNVTATDLPSVEPDTKSNWFTLDTTFRAVNFPIAAIEDPYDPYVLGTTIAHAIHYYSQRTHGHAWFDRVSNEKGWRVSFAFDLDRLEADEFQETNIDKSGFGVYVNDGVFQEIIYFYEDRIRLFYANVFVPINTATERDYAIVGKGNSLKIYQKTRDSAGAFQLLLDGSGMFTSPAVKTGNSRKPKIILDSLGVYHAVWQDDGINQSQIFYSSFDGNEWDTPDIVMSSDKFNVRSPSLAADSLGRVWVVYEDTSFGRTEISVSVRDNAGWNPKVRITNFRSDKARPDVKVDSFDNVHVTWEDNRHGRQEILWAEWTNTDQAWKSSGQFDEDTVVMQIDDTDPYQSIMDFKNAKLEFVFPNLWLTCEGHLVDGNESVIYLGFRNVETGVWNTSGTPFVNDAGDVASFGTSQTVSELNRNSINPSIAVSSSQFTIVVAWEDRTEPISQIWGASFSTMGIPIVAATQITNQTDDCKNPSAGFASDQCIIVFEKNNSLLLSSYNSTLRSFRGSAIEGNDEVIQLDDDKVASNPAVPPSTLSKSFLMLYDYRLDRNVNLLQSTENPDFQLIGDALVEHIVTTNDISTTSSLSDGRVSSLDTKEFAFGDFSENVGMLAHWRDIEMYFGYDAKPHSTSKFNTNSVVGWTDNRINDLFVDAFGNIVVATFGGLYYHNVFTSELTIIEGHTTSYDGTCFNSSGAIDREKCLLLNRLATAVKWGKNGIWYAGTTEGLFFSRTAGRFWEPLHSAESGENQPLFGKVINSISVNKDGQAVCAVTSGTFDPLTDGVYVAHPDLSSPIFIQTNKEIKVVAVDENNIIWAGSNTGLLRIENFSPNNMLSFDRSSGMRSSHVTDITIVNKFLRFIATATGVERMNGMKFTNFNVRTHGILNDNISSIAYFEETNSLYVGSLYALHEIVFKDVAHDIIEDEVSIYDNLELSTEQVFDKDLYFVLDFSALQLDDNNRLTTESTTVFINRNKISFGFTVDEVGQSVLFATDLLVDDRVEIEVSNRFTEFHNFNQTNIEKSVRGDLRRSITKMDHTDKEQLLLLSGLDKPSILLFNERQLTGLPFTTMMIDRDPPFGCLEELGVVTRTIIRFQLLVFDPLSGLDGVILSNFENFTTDGETPQEFSPVQSIIEHDIGEGINNVFDSLTFPPTTTIGVETFTVGNGSTLGTWTDESTQTVFLFAATSAPAVVFKYDPPTDTWASIQAIDSDNQSRVVNEIKTFFNVLFMVTGTAGGSGAIYQSVNGTTFDLIGSVTGAHARGIAASSDGTIFFGSSDGRIYQLVGDILSVRFQNIGQSIYSLDIFDNTMIVGTGNQGRVFTIDLETDDNLIIFDGPEDFVNEVHIRDAELVTSPDKAFIFTGSSDSTTIYKTNLDTFDFVKSYSSFNQNINRIRTVDSTVLADPTLEEIPETDTTTIASVGVNMFKNVEPSWEFFYKHTEEINDFIQYETAGVDGVWIISNSKVTKWTAILTTKTVYMRLRDKAGNISDPPVTNPSCPTEQQVADNNKICCNFAYSINIADLKNFVNESRIVDITEYGEIVFTYDSPNTRSFFSADQIDEEIGIYTSQVFNGSNDLVSWKSITWTSVEPTGTSVNVQIRTGVTEDDALSADWSANLVLDSNSLVSLEHITDQYLQFRVILQSSVRDITPTLTSVVLRTLTAQSSHFFTTNFVVPSRPVKGLLTANTFIPISSDVVFGINTNNSADFGDYQIIEPDRLFTSAQGQFGTNIRIGAKLLSPGIPQLNPTNNPGDPYDSSSFICIVSFNYQNIDSTSNNYHFRTRFYNDPFRTQLVHTFFSGSDQTGWSHGSGSNIFPATGLTMASNDTQSITFTPGESVSPTQRWYVTIDAFNGSFFETVSTDKSFICATCNIVNEPGLTAEYYKTGLGTLTSIPDFSQFTPDVVCLEPTIDFSLIETPWIPGGDCNLIDFEQNFAIRFIGKVQAPVTGTYTFILGSDDGSRLIINGFEIISMNQIQAFANESAEVNLSEGFHNIEVHFFERTGAAGLNLSWIIPGETTAATIPASRLFHAVTSEYCGDFDVPRILNFGMLFELDNGEKIKINL